MRLRASPSAASSRSTSTRLSLGNIQTPKSEEFSVDYDSGLGIGGSSVLGPVYIAELAPARIRGRLVGTFQINIVVGILLAYLSNYLITLANLGAAEWRWQLGVAAIPAAFFFGMLFSIPRSARWLTTQSRFTEAKEVLELMGSPNSEAELADIRDSLHLDLSQKRASLFERLHGGFRYGKPIFLAMAIAAFNQLSGIDAILYYLNDIFATAGFNRVSSSLQAVAIGAIHRHSRGRNTPSPA